MKGISEVFLDRNRATLLLLVMILVFGLYSYINIAREKNPDIKIPILIVSTTLRGVSPVDSERLLVKPMEVELRSVEGLDEMDSTAIDGRAYVVLKFEAGFDSKKALEDVRAKVDNIRSKLPADADSPIVSEVNLSLFPVLNVALIGDLPERTLLDIARDLQNKIESLPNVLSADIAGSRKDIVEVTISPQIISSYNLQLNDVLNAITKNNSLIGAGNLDSDTGSYSLKIQGVLENVKDIMEVPLKVDGDSVVVIKDVAKMRSTFEDATGFARVNGKPCLVLEISKRTGKNVIETVDQVKELINNMRTLLPKNLDIVYSQDQSDSIMSILDELQNTIIIAVLLVIMVIMLFMGTRISMLVALSIPGSFLIGIMIIYFMNYTLNTVVLFSLIMAVGMLVDDSIVVSEYADRKMIGGMNKRQAFRAATHDMFWPVASATLTKLAVFFPLLFWPGTTGEFMKYMPIALITTLSGSWLMALIFIPSLGSIFGKPSTVDKKEVERINAIEDGDVRKLGWFMKSYVNLLEWVLDHPKKFIFIVVFVLSSSTILYFKIGPGIKFFPDTEPDNAIINVKARGNLSVKERDSIVMEIENRIVGMKEIKVLYARSGVFQGASRKQSDDLIGKIQIEFENWRFRRKAHLILSEIQSKLSDIKGIVVDINQEKMGPSGDSKPIQINLSSNDTDAINAALKKITDLMTTSNGFINVQDTKSSPEIEWDLIIDRNKASRFGTDITVIGGFVQMITNGVIVGKYRPNNVDDEVDIIIRFPEEYRNLKTLDNLFVNTSRGTTSVSSFVRRVGKQKLKKIERVDSLRTVTVSADVLPGYLVNDRIKFLQQNLKKDWDLKVLVSFKGEAKDQKDAQSFLLKAFITALMLMILILITEFNSVYHTFVVMTAVFLSTTCVFLGLLITYRIFGVVMGGVGIIALAGIVVNNNILLIDAMHVNMMKVIDIKTSIIKASVSRVRPILLTAGTAILGFIPMILKISIDFLKREISYDSPSSQLWLDLSITIAVGLAFSTLLTLFFTPALLMLGKNKGEDLNKEYL